MKQYNPDPSKLLSHRLRGFGTRESTLQGLKAAMRAGARHVEFDIRVTKDNIFIAYHDPFVFYDDGTQKKIRDLTFDEISDRCSLSDLTTLEMMVQEFSALNDGTTKMHIDIKDEGFEENILDVCSIHDSIDDFVFVSWIPTVLHKIYIKNRSCCLCFSHITLSRFPGAYRLAKNAMKEGRVQTIQKYLPFSAEKYGNTIDALKFYFSDDGELPNETRLTDQIGFNHGHFVPNIVSGYILDELRKTRGMVCIPTFCATKSLVEKYHDYGVSVAVFSVKSRTEIKDLEWRVNPDLYYVDNSEIFSFSS